MDNVEFIRVGAFAYQKPEPFPFCETLQTKSGELVTIRCKGILKPERMGKIDEDKNDFPYRSQSI